MEPLHRFGMNKMEENKVKEEFNLEKAFEELDVKVKALEDDNISLEDSFKIYKEGMELLKQCHDSIEDIEGKVLVLDKNGGTYEFQSES